MNRPSYSDKIKRLGNPGIEFMANLYALPWFDIITQLSPVVEILQEAADQFDLGFICQNFINGEFAYPFSKIPGVCRVEREAKKDPDIREIYYVRGILRKKLTYFDEGRALQWLRAARSWDVKVDELREIALRVRNWTQFGDAIGEVIARQRRNFNAEDDSEG